MSSNGVSKSFVKFCSLKSNSILADVSHPKGTNIPLFFRELFF